METMSIYLKSKSGKNIGEFQTTIAEEMRMSLMRPRRTLASVAQMFILVQCMIYKGVDDIYIKRVKYVWFGKCGHCLHNLFRDAVIFLDSTFHYIFFSNQIISISYLKDMVYKFTIFDKGSHPKKRSKTWDICQTTGRGQTERVRCPKQPIQKGDRVCPNQFICFLNT